MKARFFRCFGAVLLLSVIITACKKDDDRPGNPGPGNGPDTTSLPAEDVHAVGRVAYIATYWKNGVAHTLGSAGGSSDATGIAISGNDVYVVGYEVSRSGSYTARIWKNGVAGLPGDTRGETLANGIAIDGADIYVAGQERNARGYWTAVYWKNGTAVRLTPDSENAVASAIAVHGGAIYVIGERSPDARTVYTCYWRNGVLHTLSDSTGYAADQSIAVAGSDVYAAWSESYTRDGRLRTWYSKNFDPPALLDDGTGDARGSGIAATAGNVWIAGSGPAAASNSVAAKFWMNGRVTELTNGSRSAFATCVALLERDVYVGGWAETAKASVAAYWKNGTQVALSSGADDALLRAIQVVKRK